MTVPGEPVEQLEINLSSNTGQEESQDIPIIFYL